MARRNQILGANVSRAAAAAGVDVAMIAKATDIPASDVQQSLDGDREFTFGELVAVGGLLRVRLSSLFEGVRA